MALVVLSVVEQRLDAVRLVLAGALVSEVAAQVGVSRQSVHTWVVRYLSEGVGGLADRSSRPLSCPHRAPEPVERAVIELRREHPRWGARRIRLELLRVSPPWHAEQRLPEVEVPSVSTINRILRRQGLVKGRPRRRSRDSYIRFERPGPMQLWGIDIVGGIVLVNTGTGELREAKVVTGVDDHSRFCVMAVVVERATARAVCLAFAQALARYGVPEEVITDNGKQFTDRFNRYGPNGVLFEPSQWSDFVEEVNTRATGPSPLTHAFIVTDAETEYRQVVSKFPTGLVTHRLYSDYLRSFEINTPD